MDRDPELPKASSKYRANRREVRAVSGKRQGSAGEILPAPLASYHVERKRTRRPQPR